MLSSKSGRIVAMVAAIAFASVAQAQLPLLPNQAVTTHSQFSNNDGYVVTIFDIRDPDCNGVPAPTCTTASQNPPCITNWPAPRYSNAMPNPTNNPLDVWNGTNLGSVFGLELDNDPNPNIYVTSTSIFFGGVPNGNITKIDGTTGAISPFATLPNSGQGLGNIAFEPGNRQFYVTNHEDGKIYRLSFAGAVIDSFDPFGPDDGVPGFAPLGQRLWAVQINPNDGRLYFGRWTEDAGTPGTPNQVWSVALNPNGSFNGPELLEVTLPGPGNCTVTHPVADLAFSESGNMLVGTRGMFNDTQTFPHVSQDVQYTGGHLAWSLANQYDVGLYTAGCGRANSAGGVDYTDCVEDDACNPGDLAIFMADALDLNSPGPNPNNIYGLQITPVGTGSLLNSYYVDLDVDVQFQDKTGLGDVDVVRTCVVPPFGTGACCIDATPDCLNAISESDCLAQGGRYAGDGSTCATAIFNPPCGDSGTGDIPTISQWGLAVLALALLIGAKLTYSRRAITE